MTSAGCCMQGKKSRSGDVGKAQNSLWQRIIPAVIVVNRPTHCFETPSKAANLSLAIGNVNSRRLSCESGEGQVARDIN